MRIATDVGGTFTDLVCFVPTKAGADIGEIRIAKVDTTPRRFEDGVMNVIERAGVALAETDFFAHGTTVVINALTERKGAKTALITTRGFRDVLEIGRGNRPDLFNFRYQKPVPLIPRYLRLEITERIDCMGKVLIPVALAELAEIAAVLKQNAIEAVAICFLHSYRNAIHETQVAARLSELVPDIAVVTSSQITQEWREYERTNTVAAAAFVQKTVRSYLESLEARLHHRGYRKTAYVMRSNGGMDTIGAAKTRGITMVESGPAGGMFGAAALGELIGVRNLIALDIGGTTAKCSLIENGRVRVTNQYTLERTRRYAGYPLLVPVVDIVEIGNGGGSIAWIDSAGKLHVGPRSAGAEPGPASYGRGGSEFTTTDAHVLTGRIDPAYFLGGRIKADVPATRAAAQRLGSKLSATADEVARGVLRIADINMVNALKLVSLNRGYDPRQFSLVAFGGGGGLHATSLARKLNIPKVIIPANASVFSAWGMLLSDLRRDYVVSSPVTLSPTSLGLLQDEVRTLEARARQELQQDGIPTTRLQVECLLDARYETQEHTVKIGVARELLMGGDPSAIEEIFRTAFEREFSYRLSHAVEVVNLHLVVQVPVDKIMPAPVTKTGRKLKECVKGQRSVDFDEFGIQDAIVYDRAYLEPELQIPAPALIEDPETTVVIDSGRATVDRFGNIHIDVGVA